MKGTMLVVGLLVGAVAATVLTVVALSPIGGKFKGGEVEFVQQGERVVLPSGEYYSVTCEGKVYVGPNCSIDELTVSGKGLAVIHASAGVRAIFLRGEGAMLWDGTGQPCCEPQRCPCPEVCPCPDERIVPDLPGQGDRGSRGAAKAR